MLKLEVRGKTISYSSYKKKLVTDQKKSIDNELELLHRMQEPNPSQEIQMTEKEFEWQNIRQEKHVAAAFKGTR